MASSKSFLLLFCALLALFLLVSAEVSTSHDDKTSEESGKNAEVDQYGGPRQGGYPGGGHGGYGRGGRGGYGGGCRYGCCRGYRHGRGCNRCCANGNEAPDAEFEDDARN